MSSNKELRFSKGEIRVAKSDDGKMTIEGYAARFNSPSQDLGGFREVIKPGAFKRALSEGQDVRALVNHDPNQVIGRSTAGTLKLNEDDNGLRFACEMPDTSYARDLAENLRAGNIDQCSFGFSAVQQRWTNTTETPEYAPMMDDGDGDNDNDAPVMVRELHDVDLYDVSAVTYPAYTETSVALRSLQSALEQRVDPADNKTVTEDVKTQPEVDDEAAVLRLKVSLEKARL